MAEPSSLSSGEMQSSSLDPICSQKSTEACVDPAFLDSIAQSKHQVPASSQAPDQAADAALDASLKEALSQTPSTTGQESLVDTPDSSQALAPDTSAPALAPATAVEATSKDTSVHQAPLSEIQSESLSHSTTVSDIPQSQSQDSAAASAASAVESVFDASEVESASASSSSSASLSESESAAALDASLESAESAVTTSKVADVAFADSKVAAEIDASQSDMGQALEVTDTAQKTEAADPAQQKVAADVVQEKEASYKVEQSEPSQALLGLAVEAWRFTNVFDRAVSKLDPKEQTRYQNQKQWFVRKLHEALQQSDLRFVDVTGQIYEPGMAVTPINLDECSPDQVLIVERMLEPIIMHQDQLLKMGTVSLCPQEPETKPEDVAETKPDMAGGSLAESANQSRVSAFVAAQVYPFQSSDANLSASTVKTPQVTQVIKTANLPLVEEHSGSEAVPQAEQQPGVAASHLASEALVHDHDSKSDQSSHDSKQSVHNKSSHDTSKDLKINVAAFISNKEIFLP